MFRETILYLWTVQQENYDKLKKSYSIYCCVILESVCHLAAHGRAVR